MPYITSVERLAKEEGAIEATITTLQQAILDILALRFTAVPVSLGERLHQIDEVERLRELHRQAIIVSSLEQFQQLLGQHLGEK